MRKVAQGALAGVATLGDGGRGRAYRALVALVCGECGRPIPPGALFSRHAPRVRAPGQMAFGPAAPICAACRPLRLDEQPGERPGTGG